MTAVRNHFQSEGLQARFFTGALVAPPAGTIDRQAWEPGDRSVSGTDCRMERDNDLKTLLGYQVQLAELVMTSDARRALDPHGLTPAKLTALLLIRANPGCDQTALGRALSINRSSAMKLVNSLAARNLVERRPGRDLRTNALHLLPRAEEELGLILADLRESDRRMSARLTDTERATLHDLLRKLGPTRKSASATRREAT